MRLKGFGLAAVVLLLVLVGGGYYYSLAGAAGNPEPGGSDDPLVTKSYVDKYVQWQVAELNPGQSFIAGAGTELILRRGAAVAVDPTGNGIPDLTGGQDITAGKPVPLNHLLIFPRDDKRGIKAQKGVVVMYRSGGVIQ